MTPASARRIPDLLLGAIVLALLALATSGCSLKKFAAKNVANSLTSGPDVYASDDDPELIRDAIPFGLKTMESLLQIIPEHRGLLLTCCRGFTEYSFGFVHADADEIESTDRARANRLGERALKLYLRARGYGFRGLELDHKKISEELVANPEAAAARLGKKDVPMLYWTAAAWGQAISVGRDRPELTADIASVKALITRGLALDEGFEYGSFHDAMIVLESLPAMMGGSLERARQHFQRAVELSQGRSAVPYVMLAENVCVQQQDRAEFTRVLDQALAIDANAIPAYRLETMLMQRRARDLIARADDLFLDADTTHVEENH